MRYRVVFRERSDQTGEKADNPPSFLDPQLTDDVVVDAVFVGRLEPEALHSSDQMEEDDGFLSLTPEIWEYEVADGRDQEFRDALQNSGMVLEVEQLEAADELGLS